LHILTIRWHTVQLQHWAVHNRSILATFVGLRYSFTCMGLLRCLSKDIRVQASHSSVISTSLHFWHIFGNKPAGTPQILWKSVHTWLNNNVSKNFQYDSRRHLEFIPMIVVDNLRHRRGGSKICFKFHVERSVSYFLDLYQFSRPLAYKRSHLCYSVVSVCLLSVTYVLWLNGVSYQRTTRRSK